MKTIKFFAIIAITALSTVSCVEKSAKYQALLAQRDSLQLQMKNVEGEYNQTMELLSDVDAGFASISETESRLKVDMKGVEGKSANKKQEIAEQFDRLKQVLEDNRARLAKLQSIASKVDAQSAKNKQLIETVKRMQAQLEEKTASISALQQELAQKDIKISELNKTVTGLNENVEKLNDESAKQQATIKTQDESLNTVWYFVGTSKQLADARIVTSNGLFRAKSVLSRDFNKSVFVSADKRNLNVIPTHQKSVKILSNHPGGSYSLSKGEDNTVTIEIRDADQFWSVSRYLVIEKK